MRYTNYTDQVELFSINQRNSTFTNLIHSLMVQLTIIN